MRLKLSYAIVVVMLALSQAPAAVGAMPADLSSARKAIAAGNQHYLASLVKGDAAGFSSLYTADGIQMPYSGAQITRGRAAIEKQAAADAKSISFSGGAIKTTNLAVSGAEAYETGTFRFTYTAKGKPGVVDGRYFVVWQRQNDGSYRIKVDSSYPRSCPK